MLIKTMKTCFKPVNSETRNSWCFQQELGVIISSDALFERNYIELIIASSKKHVNVNKIICTWSTKTTLNSFIMTSSFLDEVSLLYKIKLKKNFKINNKYG